MLLLPLLKCSTNHLYSSTFWSPLMLSRCWWMSVGAIFSTWRNSVTHLCFLCTSMSDTILSDCPSAAMCHMTTTTCDRILVGSLNCCCHTNTICLWHCRTTSKKKKALLSEQPLYLLPFTRLNETRSCRYHSLYTLSASALFVHRILFVHRHIKKIAFPYLYISVSLNVERT